MRVQLMGGVSPMYDDDDILDFIAEHADPVVSTSEVANEFEYSQQNATYRLNNLVTEGRLHKALKGGAAVYWIPGNS
jgi:predicted HTH transcriptional regulator